MKTTGQSFQFKMSITVIATLIAMFTAVTAANGQPGAEATPEQVTFSKDVAPIFQEKCQSCHRPDNMAPMSLLTYGEARPYARAIKQRVMLRTMPPWFIEKGVGIQHFANDISLSDAQIATIVKWVDEGAPQGDPKDMPPPKVFAEDGGWQLPKILGHEPDLVLNGPDDTVKAGSTDQWFRAVSDVGLAEPRWVMAVEMRPSTKEGRKVFHHITVNLAQDETNAPSAQVKVSLDQVGSDRQVSRDMFLMEWAVGKNYDLYRQGTGKLLMPGAKIWWEYHEHSLVDQNVTAHGQLAVYLYPKGVTPKYRTYLTIFQAGGGDLNIAPNSVSQTQGFTVLKAPARFENFQAHMHLRGKAMSMEAILPDGKVETLSYVDRFRFDWMMNYVYADDAAPVLPKGTIIHVTAWHDNTRANPSNPDPEQWVGSGGRTVDEMAHAFTNVTYISDQDYKDWVAQHQQPSPKIQGKGEGSASAQ